MGLKNIRNHNNTVEDKSKSELSNASSVLIESQIENAKLPGAYT